MSILNVVKLSHGFGDRAIFTDVSFRLLKGEHVGFVGANGEGKSTFMNIITGKLMPDEGKIEWSKNVRVGYLDQHTVLEQGQTIRDVLQSAFGYLFDLEAQMNAYYAEMAEADAARMEFLMEETGSIQETLEHHDFYIIDSKVDEIGRALGLADIGMDRDVTELSGGQRTKVLMGKLLLENQDLLLRDEPTNGIDVGAKFEIYHRVRQLTDNEDLEKRIGVMFISSEIDELLNVCDKIYVSADGDVIQGFDRKDFNKQDILSVAVRGKKLDE